jgi:uncharacterized protein YndB with AHSA1/START domain
MQSPEERDVADVKTIIITRTFDTPRKLVFEAWLDPKHLIHWHRGSSDWTTPFAESDGRKGGPSRLISWSMTARPR